MTHVLLPQMCLLRRRDGVEQIGSALLAFGDGAGHRSIADRLGVPASTVRGWLRRFNAKATFLAGQFVAVARRLDPSLGHIRGRGSPARKALEAVGVAAGAAVRRFGPGNRWFFVSGVSGGRLLSNTNSPFQANS